ncbi:MAG: hypothetical protein JO091_03585 [Acidobacteriaceae bacterium]|nr:hypothetical protein [Acidobacteriaceae bacterium]
MKQLAIILLGGALMCGPVFAQKQNPDPSNPQHSQDVPHQEPGTNNPDLGQQRQPSSGTSTDTQSTTTKAKGKRHKSKSTSSHTQTT